MLTRQGIAVSPGVAIAPAVVLDADDRAVAREGISMAQVPAELERLQTALVSSREEIGRQMEVTASSLGSELAGIFGFHQGMLADKHLLDQLTQQIRQERVRAEYAVFAIFGRLAETFLAQDNAYFRERVTDIYDLKRRVLRHLGSQAGGQLTSGPHGSMDGLLGSVEQPVILVARDLTPSQTAALDKTRIRAIATDLGGRTSHTAILAHALGIPAVVGLGDITQAIQNGDTVILDGNDGLVLIDPNATQLLKYRQELERETKAERGRDALRDLPAQTSDGTRVTLLANIEFPDEIPAALEKGAEGVGLFRTEYLFLGAEKEPDEDEQYAAYLQAVKLLSGKPLTIRTLDLGADKQDSGLEALKHLGNERNPFLGCRSIRLCLQNLPLFSTQLRAILRASAHGPIKVMFPLVSHLSELRQAKMVLNDAMNELADRGIAFDQHIKVGMMVEVPSAAIQAHAFAKEVDFFSIGTNDLVQYTVAVDRGNERIANLYTDAHPAVLHLIKEVLRAGSRAKIEVSLCGEMGGDLAFVPFLAGLGMRNLSITPPAIPQVKEIIRSVSLKRCQRIAREAASFDTEQEVTEYLHSELAKISPHA